MIELQSTITCPECGCQATETMPIDACQYIYDCKRCGARMKPKAGDCCVYCSYGSMPCPPIQEERAGGVSASCRGGAVMAEEKRACSEARAKDWASDWRTLVILWGLPGAAMFFAMLLEPAPRAVVWSVMLIWMGSVCLANARHCGRTHCRFTGPFFLVMAALVAAYAIGGLQLGPHGWAILGGATVIGNTLIWWASERLLGVFPRTA